MGTIKKGKKYFLGFPLYYRLFAPLWDQLKPYSLKSLHFMANYLFWQSSMALSIFFILRLKFPPMSKLKMALDLV